MQRAACEGPLGPPGWQCLVTSLSPAHREHTDLAGTARLAGQCRQLRPAGPGPRVRLSRPPPGVPGLPRARPQLPPAPRPDVSLPGEPQVSSSSGPTHQRAFSATSGEPPTISAWRNLDCSDTAWALQRPLCSLPPSLRWLSLSS